MPAYQMNPDQMGQIVRNAADGKTQLVHARWKPTPQQAHVERNLPYLAYRPSTHLRAFNTGCVSRIIHMTTMAQLLRVGN